MATIQSFNKDDQQQNPSAAPTLSMGNNTPASTPSAAPTVQKPSSSGRFTNLQTYLNANKGYKQDQGGLAGQISGNFQNKANNIQNNLNQSQQQFQNQANQNRIQYNQGLVDQAVSNPSDFANNQDNVKSFERLRDATYQGPKGIEEAQANQLQAKAGQLQQNANLAGSEAGRFTLLNKLYNTPTYNRGQQNLDNLLLQGNQQQLQKLGGVNQLATSVNTGVNTGLNSARDLASQFTQEAAQAQQNTRNALGQAVGQFDVGAKQSLADLQAKQSQDYNQALQQLQSGTASRDLANQLGILPPGGNKIETFGTDVSKFLQQGPQATLQQAVSPEQAARIQSLSKLAGNSLTGDSQNLLSQYQGQLGGAGPAFNFNKDAFGQAIKERQNTYNQKAQDIQNRSEDEQRKVVQQFQGQNVDPANYQRMQVLLNLINKQFDSQRQDLSNEYQVGKGLNIQ